eukprot:8709144-Pyramimonas_sp.AAC.1
MSTARWGTRTFVPRRWIWINPRLASSTPEGRESPMPLDLWGRGRASIPEVTAIPQHTVTYSPPNKFFWVFDRIR